MGSTFAQQRTGSVLRLKQGFFLLFLVRSYFFENADLDDDDDGDDDNVIKL